MRHLEIFLSHIGNEKHYSKNTLKAYKHDILAFHSYYEEKYAKLESNLKSITHKEVRAWLMAMSAEGLSNRTINRKLFSLKAYFHFLKQEGHIKNNPVSKLITPKFKTSQPQFVKQSCLERLSEEKANKATNQKTLITEILYQTGIRCSELIEIKIRDIDFHTGTVKVLGKGNKERLVPLQKGLLEEIKKVIGDKIKNGNQFLITKKDGNKSYPKLIYRAVNEVLSTITTQKKKSPHILRHSFATHMLNSGADISTIKNLLGHSNLSATQIYTTNSLGKLKDIYQKAHPRAKKQEEL